VRELVQDGDPDLLAQLLGVLEALLERDTVDRDLVGEEPAHVPAFGERYAVIEAEEIGILGVLVLDDDGDVLERPRDVRRELVEGRANLLLEAHVGDARGSDTPRYHPR
jgi:hypothetical protein